MPNLQKRKRPIEKADQRALKRKRIVEDLASLQSRVQELDLTGQCSSFDDLPLSVATASGLAKSNFKVLTDVQKKAIPFALRGADILGAAKTGSGKTLAFLVPVLENLYRKPWTELDGLGALILAPTRELAIQIFEVLRKIGRYHQFSAGLLIGGKSLQDERERLGRMNILVCTPGRMLQHMDQTAELEMANLQMLILDEADRILDMGFKSTVDAIVEHLPKQRQTMLFSATQTKRVSDLARLSLRDAEYVSVHEHASSATPSTLQQHYILTPLPEKLDTLWSFLRANLKSKILVFLSSGKQVRFVYESFRHLQPGIPLMHLHGRQRQTARLEITSKFSTSKTSCLFATDVVARGLDFPAVDWVIQLDCPEDAETYIHRVGRTARYEQKGRAVLFLDPSEQEMLQRLEHLKVPIEMIKVRQRKQQSIRNQLQNMCFKDPALKYLGQKAFISYVKSVHVQKDKEIFDVGKLPLEEFSASFGLPGAPRIKFQKGENTKALKNAPRQALSSSEDEEGGIDRGTKDQVKTKYDRMFERRNQDVFTDHYTKLVDDDDSDAANGQSKPDGGADEDRDADQDFLVVKRKIGQDLSSESDIPNPSTAPRMVIPVAGKEPLIIDSKRREKLLKSKKAMLKLKGRGTKLIYDDHGTPHEIYELEDEEQFAARGPAVEQKDKFLLSEAERVRTADQLDKQTAKEKKRERRDKRKTREAAEREAEDDESGDEVGVSLVPYGELPGDVSMKATKLIQRPKKWFEDASDEEGYQKKPSALKEPETLEDLEALAVGLL